MSSLCASVLALVKTWTFGQSLFLLLLLTSTCSGTNNEDVKGFLSFFLPELYVDEIRRREEKRRKSAGDELVASATPRPRPDPIRETHSPAKHKPRTNMWPAQRTKRMVIFLAGTSIPSSSTFSLFSFSCCLSFFLARSFFSFPFLSRNYTTRDWERPLSLDYFLPWPWSLRQEKNDLLLGGVFFFFFFF